MCVRACVRIRTLGRARAPRRTLERRAAVPGHLAAAGTPWRALALPSLCAFIAEVAYLAVLTRCLRALQLLS